MKNVNKNGQKMDIVHNLPLCSPLRYILKSVYSFKVFCNTLCLLKLLMNLLRENLRFVFLEFRTGRVREKIGSRK